MHAKYEIRARSETSKHFQIVNFVSPQSQSQLDAPDAGVGRADNYVARLEPGHLCLICSAAFALYMTMLQSNYLILLPAEALLAPIFVCLRFVRDMLLAANSDPFCNKH
jgi:hypothetical protein